MPSQIELRTAITDQIVDALKSGMLPPWCLPWALDSNAGHPANVASKRNFRGGNPLILGAASIRHNLRSMWWATYNQCNNWEASSSGVPDDVLLG